MRQDISSDHREAIVAACRSIKGYKAISKQFELHLFTLRKFIHKWKALKFKPLIYAKYLVFHTLVLHLGFFNDLRCCIYLNVKGSEDFFHL